MPTTDLTEALDAWRDAERRCELTDPGDPRYRSTAVAVIGAWLRYQELTGGEADSFVLVADEGHSFVAVGGGVKAVLDY